MSCLLTAGVGRSCRASSCTLPANDTGDLPPEMVRTTVRMRESGVITRSDLPFGENLMSLAPSFASSISSGSSSDSSSSSEVSRVRVVGIVIFRTRRASEELDLRWKSLISAIVEIARTKSSLSGTGVIVADVRFSSFYICISIGGSQLGVD